MRKLYQNIVSGIKTAARAATLASLLNPAYAQHSEPENTKLTRDNPFKVIPVEGTKGKYQMRIITDSPKEVGTVKDSTQALDIIRGDDTASALIVGAFSDGEVRTIQNALAKMYKINPNTVSHLEPVIARGKNGPASYAIYNAFTDEKGFRSKIALTVGRKFTGEGIDYGNYVDAKNGDKQLVPESTKDLEAILNRVENDNKKRRGEGYDFIFSGIHDEDMEGAILHEFTHVLEKEIPKGYNLVKQGSEHKREIQERKVQKHMKTYGVPREQALKEVSDEEFDIQGRSFLDNRYVNRRKEEVEAWINRSVRDLDTIIEFWKGLNKEGRTATTQILQKQKTPIAEKYLRVHNGLQNFGNGNLDKGEKKLKDAYKLVLETTGRRNKWAELIAELGRGIFSNDFSYRRSERLHEEWEQDTKKDVARRKEWVAEVPKGKEGNTFIKRIKKELAQDEKDLANKGLGVEDSGYEYNLMEDFIKKFNDKKKK